MRIDRCLTFSAMLLALGLRLAAQPSQQDWAQHVGWDGVSHFTEYLIFSPGFMGPNALPVPVLPEGRIIREGFVSVGGALHRAPGDFTRNFTAALAYSPDRKRAAFDLYLVPQEFFTVSDSLKWQRNVYYRNWNERRAIGDLYVNSHLQLLFAGRHPLDLTLRAGLRTASSSKKEAARYTDAPGYYFDLSGGRDLGRHFRLYGMAGLYVWQTNQDRQYQNDAFLFGLGQSWRQGPWHVWLHAAGYLGYLNNGDRPLTLRAGAEWRQGRWGWIAEGQWGLLDLPYRSVEARARYYLFP
ncbi:MAG: hypothetical protein NW241_13690 [Bacteroidia bacterium]|nr:hypothetical protein [Bacteroidia bacterium]